MFDWGLSMTTNAFEMLIGAIFGMLGAAQLLSNLK